MHQSYDRVWYSRNGGYHSAMRTYRNRHGSVPEEIRVKLREASYGKGQVQVHEVFALAGVEKPTRKETRAERKLRIPPEERLAPELPDPCTLDSPSMEYLPGWACTLAVIPKGSKVALRKISHQQMRLLHAILSVYLGGSGHSQTGDFVQVQPTDRFPGSVYWIRPTRGAVMGDAARVSRREMLGADPVTIVFENPMRVRAPKPVAAGQYRLRIRNITPVVHTRASLCGRSKGESIIQPTSKTIQQALNRVSQVLGLTTPERNIQISVLGCDTESVECFVGGGVSGHFQRGKKRGVVEGWIGVIDVECNAVAAWLLQCAEFVSLGGSSALGFGRVRVEPMPTDKKKQISHAPECFRFRATRTASLQFIELFAPSMDVPTAAKAIENILARSTRVGELKNKQQFASADYPDTTFVATDEGIVIGVVKEVPT